MIVPSSTLICFVAVLRYNRPVVATAGSLVKPCATKFVCAWRLKLIAPVVGEIRLMGLFRRLLNSAFWSAAVRTSPATQVLTRDNAIASYSPVGSLRRGRT